MSNDNVRTISAGLERAKKEIFAQLAENALRVGRRLTNEAFGDKDYAGFTGNAQTSYTAQVFSGEALLAEYSTGDDERPPISPKIPEGETMYLEDPYEGNARSITGQVEIENEWAEGTITRIRKEPIKVRQGVTLRMAVGVEYNDYIGDPIGDMHMEAQKLNNQSFKVDTSRL